MLGCFDDGDAGGGVFGEADFGAGFGVGADCLDAEAMGEYGVMTDLVDAGGLQIPDVQQTYAISVLGIVVKSGTLQTTVTERVE